MLIFLLLPLFVQDHPPLKPSREFEITTKYELKTKPVTEDTKIVFVDPGTTSRPKETGTGLLPYLTITLKVKRWADDIETIKVIDASSKQHLKKKATDDIYSWDMGYVDDIKDKVTSGKFFVQFLRDKKPVEQIIVQVEEDGTFLVNGEKRGKF